MWPQNWDAVVLPPLQVYRTNDEALARLKPSCVEVPQNLPLLACAQGSGLQRSGTPVGWMLQLDGQPFSSWSLWPTQVYRNRFHSVSWYL